MSAERHVSTERIQSEFEEWDAKPTYEREETGMRNSYKTHMKSELAAAFLAGYRAAEKRFEEES